MAVSFVFPTEGCSEVFGANDSNLGYIEYLIEEEISIRGNTASIKGDNPIFIPFMKRLLKASEDRGELSESEICMIYEQALSEDEKHEPSSFQVSRYKVFPKSASQSLMIDRLRKDDVVFAYGPAGTGKTYISICWALSEVLSGRKNKIVLTRPVVEAGETLGYLPGDLQQKLAPYLRPLYDAMENILSPKEIQKLDENGTIEIAPLAYMRGRSLSNAVIILDEAQNATKSQMKLFLTRLGRNSQAIITGDPSQIDLRERSSSGLIEAIGLLRGIEGISMIAFSDRDTVRSRIVREIVKAYEKEGR